MLYEVLSPGYHSPLTKTQIAELFRAGRLGRDHRCKEVSHKEWRTVDELFPLLKYQSAVIRWEEPDEAPRRSAIDRKIALAWLTAALGIAAVWLYFTYNPGSTGRADSSQPTEKHRPTAISSADATPVPPVRQQQLPDWKTNDVVITAPATTSEGPRPVDTSRGREAARQREAEERQRRQAEYTRLQQERDRQEQKAHGQDLIIPLDQDILVNVAGGQVRVKIHDNDVTSFDVWINGAWHREVPKQKGITQSGKDETLIYDAGRARLYYVWEISGTLNHCLLRVRQD